MKRARIKEVVLLMLPCVALLGLGVLPRWQGKTQPSLTLASITSSKVAKSQFNTPDIKVDARFNRNQSFTSRVLQGDWGVTFSNAYIADRTGKKHYMMTTNELGDQQSVLSRVGVDEVHFPLWLRYFPKSAGKLTLHFTASTPDGFKLPTSLVVRS